MRKSKSVKPVVEAVTEAIVETPNVTDLPTAQALEAATEIAEPMAITEPEAEAVNGQVTAPTHCACCGQRLPKQPRVKAVKAVSTGSALRKMDSSRYPEQYLTEADALIAYPNGVISVAKLCQLARESGIIVGRVGRAFGGDRNRYPIRSPIWKVFLVSNRKYVRQECVADLPNLATVTK